MNLGLIKRIAKDDLSRAGGDMPKWLDPLIDTLNQFIEKTTTALNNNLSFQDNFLCKVHSQDFSSGTAYKINPLPEGRQQLAVDGVLLLDANGGQVDSFKWEKLSDGISVTIWFTSAVTKKCKILILLR